MNGVSRHRSAASLWASVTSCSGKKSIDKISNYICGFLKCTVATHIS